jgi:hypothetical protein
MVLFVFVRGYEQFLLFIEQGDYNLRTGQTGRETENTNRYQLLTQMNCN